MTVNINILGIEYPAPSTAADTNWAAIQVALEQALAAGINSVNTDLAELTASVTSPAWVQVATGDMLNGWEAGATCARSKSIAGVVTLQFGMVFNGTPTLPCIQLPSGWRPPTALALVALESTSGLPCRLDIATNGNVTLSDIGSSDVSNGATILVSFATSVT